MLERELAELRANMADESVQESDLRAEAERLRAEAEQLRRDLERQKAEAARSAQEAARAQQDAARAHAERAAQEQERKRLARELEAQRAEQGRHGRAHAAPAPSAAEAELQGERARVRSQSDRLAELERALTSAADSQVMLEQDRDRLAAELADLRAGVPAAPVAAAVAESREMADLRRRLKRARRKLRQARSQQVAGADVRAAAGEPTVTMRVPSAAGPGVPPTGQVTTVVTMSSPRAGGHPSEAMVQITPTHYSPPPSAASWPRTRALTPQPPGTQRVTAAWSQAPAAPAPAEAPARDRAPNVFGDPFGFTPLAYDPTQVPPPPAGGAVTGPLGTRISASNLAPMADKTFTSRLARQPVMTVRHAAAPLPTASMATTQSLEPMPPAPLPLWRRRWLLVAVAAVVLLGLAALQFRSMVRALPATRTGEVVIGLDQVSAPIAGVVELPALRVGQQMRPGDPLLVVHAVEVDTSALDALKQKLADTQVRQRKADQDLATIAATLVHLGQDSDQLEAALAESERNVLTCTDELQTAEREHGAKAATMDTLNALVKVVAIPGLDWVGASQEAQEAQRKLDEREAALQTARSTRDVQRQHLSDNRKQIADFNRQVVDLKQVSATALQAVGDLTKGIAAEQEHVDSLRVRQIASPHGGQLQALVVHNNDTVKVGQPLVTLTVPSSLRISATIDASANVQADDLVIIHPQTGGHEIEGRVAAVNPASFDDAKGWSDLTPVGAGQVRLEIVPDQNGQAAGLVGQNVSVVVVGNDPGPVRWLMGMVASKLNH